MPDDLVKRLREWLMSRPSPDGRTFHPTHEEVLIAESERRIEALEAALAHIYAWYPISVTQPRQTIDDIREFAKAALGEKKDGQ